MIIPIAIDLSEHDSIPEYKHDSADFVQLSKIMHNQPFMLLHDNDSMEHSHFYQQISRLPQKSRDAFIRICKKIPRRAVCGWDGTLDQAAQSTLHSLVKVAAMSKAKFHMLFEYDEDVFVAPHPIHPEIECSVWKAIEHTHAFTHMQHLATDTITPRSLRSTLWQERFAPLVMADKWKRIKIVDRYLFLERDVDFTAIDFILGKLDKQLTHPTEIEIFVQTDKYRGYNRHQGVGFDYFPTIVTHLQHKITSYTRIAAIRIYAYNNLIGSSMLHDRFMYLYSTRELLYAYSIGVGFKIMHDEYINEVSTFTLKMHAIPSDNQLYTQISAITPPNTTAPDYIEGVVAVYIVP